MPEGLTGKWPRPSPAATAPQTVPDEKSARPHEQLWSPRLPERVKHGRQGAGSPRKRALHKTQRSLGPSPWRSVQSR